MASPDGHTRPFDAERRRAPCSATASAIVVLRRLADALADGDTDLRRDARRRGQQRRRERASFTAPSAEGQAGVIAPAHDARRRSTRARISYVEAHGTATPLGDPIEIEGLTRAFRRHTAATRLLRDRLAQEQRRPPGHRRRRRQPDQDRARAASRGSCRRRSTSTRPNPKIDFARTPFRVADRADAVAAQRPGRAAPASARSASAAPTRTSCSRRRRRGAARRRPRAAPSCSSSRRARAAALAEAPANLAAFLAPSRRRPDAARSPTSAHTLQVGPPRVRAPPLVVAASRAEAARAAR